MPVLGTGVLPSGNIGTELTAITRRAFMPLLTVQLYNSTPALSLLLRNAQAAKGGASFVTAPVQGASMVQYAWAGYDGSFQQPEVLTAISDAEFNLCLGLVPIPFVAGEAIVQSSEVVVSLLKARMKDALSVTTQQLATALFSNNQSNPLVMNGLPQAYDDGTNVAVFGGIDRTQAANAFWKGQLITGAGAVNNRTGITKKIMQVMAGAGGEAPDVLIMSLADWTTLVVDFESQEQFQTWPGTQYQKDQSVNAGFRALRIGQTSIFADLFCPVGTIYAINSKYLSVYMSSDCPVGSFSGFESTLANYQLGYVGVAMSLLNLVCTKPSSGAQITGVTGGGF